VRARGDQNTGGRYGRSRPKPCGRALCRTKNRRQYCQAERRMNARWKNAGRSTGRPSRQPLVLARGPRKKKPRCCAPREISGQQKLAGSSTHARITKRKINLRQKKLALALICTEKPNKNQIVGSTYCALESTTGEKF
jgi:hypothetical protein